MLITALFYLLGRLSIYKLSRAKLFEIVAAISLKSTYISKRSLLRSWHYLFYAMTLPFWSYALVELSEQFKLLQQRLFQPSLGIFIADTEALFFTIFLFLSIAFYLLLTIFLLRISPLRPNEYWKKYPEVATIKLRIKQLRNRGLIISLLLQILFVHTMLNYTIIKDSHLVVNRFGNLNETIVPLKHIKQVSFSYQYSDRVERNTTVIERPVFRIAYEDKEYNIYLEKLKLSDAVIEKMMFRLAQDSVKIQVNYPGITLRQKWQDFYSKEQYNYFIQIFDYASLLSGNLTAPVKMQETIAIDRFKIRVDSVMFSDKANIVENLKEYPLLVYVTLTNDRSDTTYFGTMISTKIVDRNLEEYEGSFFAKDLNSSAIPPNKTIQIMRAYNVPAMSIDNLKLRYQPNIMKEQYIYFELE